MNMFNQSSSARYSQPVTSEERATFIKKTYMHVALAVLLFIGVEYLFLNTPAIVKLGLSMTQGWTWLIVLGGFMLVTNYAERLAISSDDKQMHYAGLVLYVVAEAFIFIPLIFIAMAVADGGAFNLLYQAAILTVSLFTALSAIVFMTKKCNIFKDLASLNIP